LFWKVEHMFIGRFPTFSLATPNDEWILLSLETTSNLNGCCQCWFDLHKYGAMSIDNDNMQNDDNYLGKDIIIHLTNIRRWLHSLCYWNIWVFSLSFWFIFYYLCIDLYHTSLLLLMLVFYYQQRMFIAL